MSIYTYESAIHCYIQIIQYVDDNEIHKEHSLSA